MYLRYLTVLAVGPIIYFEKITPCIREWLSKYLIWRSPEIRTCVQNHLKSAFNSAWGNYELINCVWVFSTQLQSLKVTRFLRCGITELYSHVCVDLVLSLFGLLLAGLLPMLTRSWPTSLLPLPSNWTPLLFSPSNHFHLFLFILHISFFLSTHDNNVWKNLKKVGKCTVIYKFHYVRLKDCVFYTF